MQQIIIFACDKDDTIDTYICITGLQADPVSISMLIRESHDYAYGLWQYKGTWSWTKMLYEIRA